MERIVFFIRNSREDEILLEDGDEIDLAITALNSPATLVLKIRRKKSDLRSDPKEINPEDHVYGPS